MLVKSFEIFVVAHRVFGVASSINSANYIYFVAMDKVLKLNHPKAMEIFTRSIPAILLKIMIYRTITYAS